MAKKKVTKISAPSPEGLSIRADLKIHEDEFGKKLLLTVALLQDGQVISEDKDFVKLPLK